MQHRWFIYFFFLIVLLAGLLRFYKLGSIPQGVYIDEVAMLVDAKSVSQSGLDMHGRPWYQVLYPSYGDYKLPMYLWLVATSVTFFGVSDWALRLPSALAGMATVIVAGLLAKELITDKKLQKWSQLSVMLTVAVSPWSVLFSRTGFEGHVGQLLVASSVWMALLSRRHWWLLPLSAIVGGLATYSYFSVRFVWPVVFVVMSCLFLVSWSQKSSVFKEIVSKVIMPLIVFSLLLIPMLCSPLYADTNKLRLSTDSVLQNDQLVIQSNLLRELAGNSTLDRVIFHRYWLMVRELLLNYGDNLSPAFLFISGDPNLRHGTGDHGLFLLPFLPCLLLGLWYLFDKQKSVLALVSIWWLAALLPASIPENTPHALRSLNALMPLSLVMGVGLAYLLSKLSSKLKWGVFLLLGGCVFSFGYHYFHFYAADSGPAWQQGFSQIVSEIYSQKDYDHLYILPFDERFYLWMMAYGPLTAEDFHQWQSQYFMFKNQPGVTFDGFSSWQNVPNQAQRVMVVGRLEQVQEVLARSDVHEVRKQIITDLADQNSYAVAVIEPNL